MTYDELRRLIAELLERLQAIEDKIDAEEGITR